MRRRSNGGTGWAPWLAILALLAPGAAFGQADPLTIRISDAEGEPGGPVAIVLRTYASRPVSQGRLGFQAGGAALARQAGGVAPFASFDGGTIFGIGGDVVEDISWDDATQTADALFSSLSASVNAADGILAVFYFTLDAGVTPGATYALDLLLGPGFEIRDANGDPMPWVARGGELDILAPGAPATLEVGGPKVHPGAIAQVEIETVEPFAVESGVIELTFPSALLLEPISVQTDPHGRHGSVALTSATLPEAGRLRIEFFSPSADYNEAPGALFVVNFRTSAATPVGTMGSLSLDAAATQLLGPGASPIDLLLAGDVVEFVNDPGIFHDDFEWGTAGAWTNPGI